MTPHLAESRRKHPRAPDARRLRERVAELEETLRAIQSGEVDALVVGEGGHRKIFTLEGADSSFRTIVEQMSEGALTIRPGGTILYCNATFAALVGEPLDRIIGSTLMRFAHEKSREALQQMITSARAGTARTELRFTGRASESLPVLVSMSSLKDYAVDALCVSVADLSAQKLQAQLAVFNEELELRVQIRTKELLVANRELEAFSYSASHDLRGPLRIIGSYSDLLSKRLKDGLDKQDAEYLRAIGGGVKRMDEIIEALLTLSSTTKAPRIDEKVDITRVAEELAAEQTAAAPGRRVSLHVDPGLAAQGDPRLLRQLLHNLIANAWKFTATRAAAHVSLKRVSEGGEEAFCLQDDGVGFDMAYVDKMFQPFQRLHAEEGFSGTGIGLALAQRIVERHGGRIWARGEPGRGASIYFTLTRAAPPSAGARNRVLFVEGDADDRTLTLLAFKEAGFPFSVEIARDGEEAWNRLRNQAAAEELGGVILDLNISKLSGLELLRRVRQLKPLKGLPVVVLSSSSDQKDMTSAHALGISDYLIKPLGYKDLEGVVKRLREIFEGSRWRNG